LLGGFRKENVGAFISSIDASPPAGTSLFALPAGGGIWAAAHQRSLFSSFVYFFCFVIIFEGLLALFFTDSPNFYFPAGFFGFAERFSNI
jgi:hypothetical protein